MITRRRFTGSFAWAPAAALTAGSLAAEFAHAQTGPKKPKPPPGRDPGGVAVAVIGAGLDYRRPEIAARLARDGEGEIIGWDLIDNDPFPLELLPRSDLRIPPYAGTDTASVLLSEAPKCRLIPIRVPDASVAALTGAMRFAAQTPARVVLILSGGAPNDHARHYADAMWAAKQHLVVAPSLHATTLLHAVRERGGTMSNLLTMTATTREGAPFAELAARDGMAVAAVPLTSGQIPPPNAPDRSVALANTAGARAAAMVARLWAVAPQLNSAGLQMRIARDGEPLPGHSDRGGPGAFWLPQVEHLYRTK